ncbi:MAG: ThiF family adenylyltransferase [Prevotellamassilia sp.]
MARSKSKCSATACFAINPEAEITALQQSYSKTASSFALGEYDYVIDAIDSLQDKARLILEACRARRPRLFASMGQP